MTFRNCVRALKDDASLSSPPWHYAIIAASFRNCNSSNCIMVHRSIKVKWINAFLRKWIEFCLLSCASEEVGRELSVTRVFSNWGNVFGVKLIRSLRSLESDRADWHRHNCTEPWNNFIIFNLVHHFHVKILCRSRKASRIWQALERMGRWWIPVSKKNK